MTRNCQDRLIALIRGAASGAPWTSLRPGEADALLEVALDPDHDLFRFLQDHAQANPSAFVPALSRLLRLRMGGVEWGKPAAGGYRVILQLGNMYGVVRAQDLSSLLRPSLTEYALAFFEAWETHGPIPHDLSREEGDLLRLLSDRLTPRLLEPRVYWEAYTRLILRGPVCSEPCLRALCPPAEDPHGPLFHLTAEHLLRVNFGLIEGTPVTWRGLHPDPVKLRVLLVLSDQGPL